MSRFQAQTNAVLEQELEELSERLGLRPNQKADLLRELTALASWVIRQADAGRTVEARGEGEAQPLVHPVVERLLRIRRSDKSVPERITLSDEDVERLAAILERGFCPTPDLRDLLHRLAQTDRQAPELTWHESS
jgi:hypothetical protein